MAASRSDRVENAGESLRHACRFDRVDDALRILGDYADAISVEDASKALINLVDRDLATFEDRLPILGFGDSGFGGVRFKAGAIFGHDVRRCFDSRSATRRPARFVVAREILKVFGGRIKVADVFDRLPHILTHASCEPNSVAMATCTGENFSGLFESFPGLSDWVRGDLGPKCAAKLR